MELHEQHCWELKGGQLVPAEDPAGGDGDVDQNIFAAGYSLEICSKHDDSYSNAELKIYKNTSSTNQNPLFYIDIMGDKTGLSALIARDFKQLAETLNYLSGLLSVIRLDQSAAIARSMVQPKR